MARTIGCSKERRIAAVRAVVDGKEQVDVARVLGVSPAAVCNWMRLYGEGGFDALKGSKASGRPPKLNVKQEGRLVELLKRGAIAAGFQNELWTGKRVAGLIGREFGIAYHDRYVPTLLRKLGFTLQRPMRVARERDEKRVRSWSSRTWPRLKKRPR